MTRDRWVFAGIFLLAFSTLLVELLDARLLSVQTWYHLSFLAVSLAMLGMAAGAVHVFLGGAVFQGAEAFRRLPRVSARMAVAIAASHLVTLSIPIPSLNRFAVMEVIAIGVATCVLAVPFYLSGVALTIGLTRTNLRIGRLYACDLAGAAFACVAVVPLLDSGYFNLSALMFMAAGLAAAAAYCFARVGESRRLRTSSALLAGILIGIGLANGGTSAGIDVVFPKNQKLWMAANTYDRARWNSHSYVIVQRPAEERVFMWGAGGQSESVQASVAWIAIDGEAGTPMTRWNGDVSTLGWVRHDVTALPYYLRHGAAAVIGVGGGRDVLAAIWARSGPIVGIDVNGTVLDLLTKSHRGFAAIADYPGIQLVHDDARAFLARTPSRFDVIQMSLIDTWAATGAGAFTLSENGLYTVEAWKMFLARLNPDGVFSVSRWFAPQNVSETNRLLSLAVASLLESGIRDPRSHVLLVSRGGTATLLMSPSGFSAADEAVVRRVVSDEDFTIQVSPWTGGATSRLDRIARSQTQAELAAATRDRNFDYSAPSDDRPFFFNMLKPASFARAGSLPRGGIIWGNIRATVTLVVLFMIATLLVALIIGWPLLAAGAPPMPRSMFVASLAYFACIGFGFMAIQIGLLQRLSIYLGHPAHTLSITLFSMILFAGLGSYLSDRVRTLRRATTVALPLATAAAILLCILALRPLTAATIHYGLAGRALVVLALLAPLSTLLGFFFPTGLRLVTRISPSATAWMWGVNGACGVLGSIVAVGISIWMGIQVNLFIASALYGLLLIPLRVLRLAVDVDAESQRPQVMKIRTS